MSHPRTIRSTIVAAMCAFAVTLDSGIGCALADAVKVVDRPAARGEHGGRDSGRFDTDGVVVAEFRAEVNSRQQAIAVDDGKYNAMVTDDSTKETARRLVKDDGIEYHRLRTHAVDFGQYQMAAVNDQHQHHNPPKSAKSNKGGKSSTIYPTHYPTISSRPSSIRSTSSSPSTRPKTSKSAKSSISTKSSKETKQSKSSKSSHAPTGVGSPIASPSTSPTGTVEPTESLVPTMAPTNSAMPSASSMPSGNPSVSARPSVSYKPSISDAPSVSFEPTLSARPSISTKPSISGAPSARPSISSKPSISDAPSVRPSTSFKPTEQPVL